MAYSFQTPPNGNRNSMTHNNSSAKSPGIGGPAPINKTNLLMNSLILAPPGQPAFDTKTLARMQYQEYMQAQHHTGSHASGTTTNVASPIASMHSLAARLGMESPSNYARLQAVLSSPSQAAGLGLGGMVGPGPAGPFFHGPLTSPYHAHMRPGDHLIDEPLSPSAFSQGGGEGGAEGGGANAGGGGRQEDFSDQDVINQVWSYREIEETPRAIAPLKVPSPELEVDEKLPPLEREHLISPSRRQALAESAGIANQPLLKMFKLPSYTVDDVTPVQAGAQLIEQQLHQIQEQQEEAVTISSSSAHPEMVVEIPEEEDEGGISLLSPPPHGPPPDILQAHASSSPAAAVAGAQSPPHDPQHVSIDEHEIDATTDGLARAVVTRDAKQVSKLDDPWFATKHARRASHLLTAINLLSQTSGTKKPTTIDEDSPSEPEPDPFAPSEAQLLAAAQAEADRLKKEEEMRTLDKRKEIAHAQYMKLVLLHVRARLIQERKFVEAPPTNSTSTAASSSSSLTSPPRPPISQLDVYKEITGEPRPVLRPVTPPVNYKNRFLLRSPSFSSARSPSPALVPQSPQPFKTKNVRATPTTGPSPMDDVPYHIDPLDPTRPENVNKSYRYNTNYVVPHSGEWPLDSRGPHNNWQELIDDEELSAYKKVLWLCEIKAVSHIPLDGMLKLIQLLVERAFDVEVLFRAGEPGDTVYFIKAGEVQLYMDRTVVEAMEEKRVLADMTSGLYQLEDLDHYNLNDHPHPPAPSHQPHDPTKPMAPGEVAIDHNLLPTDPELKTKYVEIAKLSALGIVGEDILIAPNRRYTLISQTPVWMYEIKADELLRCFSEEARHNFLVAIAHTQRVRERHALVKSRTRLQYHQAPTLFRHFIDEGLKRRLNRIGVHGAKIEQLEGSEEEERQQPIPSISSPPPAEAAPTTPFQPSQTQTNLSPARAGRTLSPKRTLVSKMRHKRSPSRTEVLLSGGGGPDAVRAVLQDLNSISLQSKHHYRPQSPGHIEELAAQAAYTKDRKAIMQRDLMKERARAEARGGLASQQPLSPAHQVSPAKLPKFGLSPMIMAARREQQQQQQQQLLMQQQMVPQEEKQEEAQFFRTPPSHSVSRSQLSSPKNAHNAMGHAQFPLSSMRTPTSPSSSGSKSRGNGSLDNRLSILAAESDTVKDIGDEALAGAGPGAAFVRAQLLAATPAGASGSLSSMMQERQAYFSELVRTKQASFSPASRTPGSPTSTDNAGHRRRISQLTTATGQQMYDNPFGKPLLSPAPGTLSPPEKVVTSFEFPSPAPSLPPAPSGTHGKTGGATRQANAHVAYVNAPVPNPTHIPAFAAVVHERAFQHQPRRKNSVMSPPGASGGSLISQAGPSSGTSSTSPYGQTPSSGSLSASTLYDSPFAMKFNEGSIFEKSSINARPGVVLFSSTKQHVKRNSVIPLRTQQSALVILGDLGDGQEYSDIMSPTNAPKFRRRESVLDTTTSIGANVATTGSNVRLIKHSASLPTLQVPVNTTSSNTITPINASPTLVTSPLTHSLSTSHSSATLSSPTVDQPRKVLRQRPS